jgi:hypothetical protein
MEANNKLAQTYKDALKKVEETGEGKEELIKATRELAEAYDIEGAALANLSGDYEDFNKKLLEA